METDASRMVLTTLGTHGNNVGEFEGPSSSAGLSDGSIVCDKKKNRIQIFE